MVSQEEKKLRQKYAKIIGKSYSKPQDQAYDELVLIEKKEGDTFVCGSHIHFHTLVRDELKLLCFECHKKFDTLKKKFDHVTSSRHKDNSKKLCPTCLCWTSSTEVHDIEVKGSLANLLGVDQEEDADG